MARVPRTHDARLTRGPIRGQRAAEARRAARGTTGGLAAAAGLVLALAGCGSATIHELPPAAEPAVAPALTGAAGGTVWPITGVGAGTRAAAPTTPTASAVATSPSATLGGAPEGVAIDPVDDVAAVATRNPARLLIVDVRTQRTLHVVPLPGEARHLALQSSLSGARDITTDGVAAGATDVRVLVPAESAGRLLTVALPSGRVVSDVAVGDHPHDATALSPTSAVVTNERGNTITLVDGDHVVKTVPVATQPGGVSSLREGSIVAVVSVRQRKLELYDGHTLARLASVPAGIGPTHVACAPQGPCFVVDTDGDALLVFRVGTGGHDLQLTRRVYLGPPGAAPYGLALDPTHSRTRLWITLTGDNQLVELAAQGRPHVLSRRPTVRQANSVAVDQGSGDVLVGGATLGGQLERFPHAASPNR